MPNSTILIYLLRRDLRVSDNPILHSLATQKDHGCTHLLPLYVFPAQQVEVRGFIPERASGTSPYPEARSQVGGFWRCGPHRTKFLSESVWDLKAGLENVGSGLCIRVGMVGEVVREMLRGINERNDSRVGAVWMASEEGVEEKREVHDIEYACREAEVAFRLWDDEKYLIDDRDVPFDNPKELPDIFTNYRKMVEPLREKPRALLPTPSVDSLLPYPPATTIPSQHFPFSIPSTLEGIQSALFKPLKNNLLPNPLLRPTDTKSAHPFLGGETRAQSRLAHLISSGSMTTYQQTRNGLLGEDFSTKLSAWLALGCITARQIHAQLQLFEDGSPAYEAWKDVPGYGSGENEGTKAMRFELLWRDYMRLCTRKFGPRLFRLGGFRQEKSDRWASPRRTPEERREVIERFLNGTTGMGFIDASMRELYHTGYTSNRARQNVASFLAKHLNIDWRIGAEWYECMLVDYDLSSNWGNWQYLAGVGNDPRGEARIFNPVKQAYDYDPEGEYVKAWVAEMRAPGLEQREVFQGWEIRENRREELGLAGNVGVERPLLRINFTVGKRGRHVGQGRGGGRGGRSGNGNGNGTGAANDRDRGMGSSRSIAYRRGGEYAGRGYGSSRGHLNPGQYHGGRDCHHGSHGGGREARTGMIGKDRMAGQDCPAE